MHTGYLKNICRDAAYELGSKWIKIYPESATSKYSQWKPAFSETSATFLRQLLSTMRCWEQILCTSSRKRKKNQPVPSWQTRHALNRGLTPLVNQVMKTAATDAGVAGLGLPEWLINCSRAIFSSDFAPAEEQVDLRKIYYLKANLCMQSKVYH